MDGQEWSNHFEEKNENNYSNTMPGDLKNISGHNRRNSPFNLDSCNIIQKDKFIFICCYLILWCIVDFQNVI